MPGKVLKRAIGSQREAESIEQPVDTTRLGRHFAAANPTRRLKIAFVIRALTVGGAERQLVELAKGLDSKVFEVVVLCLYPGGAFTNELVEAGVPVIQLNKKGRWEVFGFLLRLAKQLRRLRPDIVHPYMTGPNLMTMMMKPLLPSSRIVWGMRSSNMEVAWHGWVDECLTRLETTLSSWSNLVIFNSAAGEAHYRSAGFARASCVTIPNGIDVAQFAYDHRGGSAHRASWGIPETSLLIGVAGRLDPMKDHPTFLKAVAIFSETRPNARFVCIGGGPDSYASKLRKLAEELGVAEKVVWTGVLSEMPAAYSALDICCSSSAFGEGTPNAIGEAMACGVPCVVTDVGDARLVVGELGVIVPPSNPKALAEGWEIMVGKIENDPRLGEAARERVKSMFSVPELIRKTSEELLRLP